MVTCKTETLKISVSDTEVRVLQRVLCDEGSSVISSIGRRRSAVASGVSAVYNVEGFKRYVIHDRV